jgi:clan AA aspartic protease
MGTVYADITLKNVSDQVRVRDGVIKEPEVRQMMVTALVDTGAWTLVINERTCQRLGLIAHGTSRSTLADGSKVAYQLSEPVEVNWKNRTTYCQAVIVPNADDILLGVLPLEAMDLLVNPVEQKLQGAHGDEALYMLK